MSSEIDDNPTFGRSGAVFVGGDWACCCAARCCRNVDCFGTLFLCSGNPVAVVREGKEGATGAEEIGFSTMSFMNPPPGVRVEEMLGPPRKSASSSRLRLKRSPRKAMARLQYYFFAAVMKSVVRAGNCSRPAAAEIVWWDNPRDNPSLDKLNSGMS